VTDKHSPLAIHRLLDEAFAGVDMTAEVQDLKEEMRANLVARAAELEHSGSSPDQAARRAMAELGDIRSVIDETGGGSAQAAPWLGQRVRPKPGFVMRTVVLSLIAAAALAAVVLGVFRAGVPLWAQAVSCAVLAVCGGVIVTDALRQETTTNYPVPSRRAIGYGISAALALVGTGLAVLGVPEVSVPWFVGGGLAVVASVIGFTYLGATQTNRHKPWVLNLHRQYHEVDDGFNHDPAAAARFGLYTVAIWLIAVAAFIVLSITVGWAWSWLALPAGVVAMMLTLARTLFEPARKNKG
jgi:hypothetical protein